jgi:hypothetical protein
VAYRTLAMRITPGKADEWRSFVDDLQGSKKAEWEAILDRQDEVKRDSTGTQGTPGVRYRGYLQTAFHGDMATYVMKGGPNVFKDLFESLGKSPDPFAAWFSGHMKSLHNLDITQPLDLPKVEQKFLVKIAGVE